jgi:hypothetical protein
MTKNIDILNQINIRKYQFILLSILTLFFNLSLDLFSQEEIKNQDINTVNEYKLGLNFKYNNLVHKLNFNEFLSTNRPDQIFNNYTDNTLQPEIFVEYKLNDLINIGMNFSYLKLNYNDFIDEQFLVSNQGTPTLANIRTSTLTNFSAFSISPKVSINYQNFAINGNFNVFFCLIQT